MKLLIDKNNIIVFLNKMYIKKTNFTDKKITEKFLRKIIKKLQTNYELEFNGYYDIVIYTDNIYGVIISIERENLEYFDYFDEQIEMDIKIVDTSFLYKLEELLDEKLLEKFIIYKNNDVFYLKPKVNITDGEMGVLLENSKIIFNQKTLEIIKTSEIVRG